MVTNPPAMQETQVRSLDWEDPLEKEMASHSSILAWGNPMDRGAWWAAVRGGHKELDTTLPLHNKNRHSRYYCYALLQAGLPGSVLQQV